MPHINIIARTNGVGLDQDVDIVHSALTAAGMQVTVSHCRSIPVWRRFFPQKTRYDANIFLERVFPRWFGSADKNFLIPNQERFPRRHLSHLGKIDHVLCKSRHAEEIFSQHTASSFIGFTSEDRSLQGATPDYQSYFHLAGRSTLKGTEALVEVWRRHPDWPTLTLLQCAENAPTGVPSNIGLITEYVSNEKLMEHLNSHGVHLCPSLSEGWGHYIVEAMSCSASVVTTNAPPMNELIQAERGILIQSKRSEPRHLGTNYFVDLEALDKQLTALVHADSSTKQQLGSNARHWFEENHSQFNHSFPLTLAKLLNNDA